MGRVQALDPAPGLSLGLVGSDRPGQPRGRAQGPGLAHGGLGMPMERERNVDEMVRQWNANGTWISEFTPFVETNRVPLDTI